MGCGRLGDPEPEARKKPHEGMRRVDFPQFIPHNGQHLLGAFATHWYQGAGARTRRDAGRLGGYEPRFYPATPARQTAAAH